MPCRSLGEASRLRKNPTPCVSVSIRGEMLLGGGGEAAPTELPFSASSAPLR
jgi:hypothetical protein